MTEKLNFVTSIINMLGSIVPFFGMFQKRPKAITKEEIDDILSK